MPTRTVTLASDHAIVAFLDVDLVTPQSGRVSELRLENNSKQRARIRLAPTGRKGHVTERIVAPSGILRVTPGAGLDPALAVVIEPDGTVRGITFELERILESA